MKKSLNGWHVASVALLMIVAGTGVAVATEPDVVTAPNGDVVVLEDKPVGLDGVLPECEYEDSNTCVWIGDESGNGVGLSFWTDAHDTVHYISADDARDLLS